MDKRCENPKECLVPVKKDGPLKTNRCESVTLVVPGAGLTAEEAMAVVRAPHNTSAGTRGGVERKLTAEAVLRLLYETFARRNELRLARVGDLDLRGGRLFIRHPKRTRNPRTGESVCRQRWVYFSNYTRTLLSRLLAGADARSHVIRSTRSAGGPVDNSFINRVVSEAARAARLPDGRPLPPDVASKVTPKALREAGERHTDTAAMNNPTAREQTAKIAGHSERVKRVHYAQFDHGENRRLLETSHPAFRDG